MESIKSYIETFKDTLFGNGCNFIGTTEQVLKQLDAQSEKDFDIVNELYSKLEEITKSNVKLYGGYLYIFYRIAYEFEFDVNFKWAEVVNEGYEWEDLVFEQKNTVQLVAETYGEELFSKYFPSVFILTLLRIVDDANASQIAEYIVSSNIIAYRGVFQNTDSTEEDWVSDEVIIILKAIGYDINDYEGDCEISGRYFSYVGYNMGYDYYKLAESFRDSNS